MMKKIISVILCVAMLFGMAALTASAAENDIKVIVANDLHLSIKAYTPFTGGSEDNPYAHFPSSGQLTRESNAIITAFFESVAKSDADYILLPGDLTDSGTQEEHLLLAAKLADFEKETGKQVFVAPGNHDYKKTTPESFAVIYSDFGYNEAVEKYDASYTADINDEYRLLVIDSIEPKKLTPEITDGRLEWIKAQLEQAKADEKKVIAMMHHNLLEHFIFAENIHSNSKIPESVGLADILADGGAKYIFTGHTHDQDIASHTSSEGNVIYDVVTNSLNIYPCAYRVVTFGENVKFEAEKVEKIDTSLLPIGISAEALALAESDFTEYTRVCVWNGLRRTFTSYLNAKSIIKLLELDAEADKQMCNIITKVGDKLAEIVQMPFYKAEAEDGEKNMEEVAAKYGKSLPASKYDDLIDLAITLYQAHCLGDEYYPSNSTEVQLLMQAVSTVLCYCLEDLSAEEYTAVLKYALTVTGNSVPDNLLNFAGGTMERVEGIDLVATLVLRPLITQFTTDDTPADNNVTLEGYGEKSDFEIFLQKIRDFFKKIADFFKMMFSFIPMPI